MFKKMIIYVFYCFLLIFFSGCFSMVGYGLGTVVDDNKSGEYFTINEELYDITPETEVQLITITNDTLSGLYIKTTNENSDEYVTGYKNKYKNLKEQFIVPEIGDTLLISNPLGDIYKYIFLGFDYNKIYVKSVLSNKNLFINLRSNAKIVLEENHFMNLDYLNNGIEYKLIPIMSKIHLKNKSDSLSVFYHNIQNIQINSVKNAKYFMLTGIAIDIILYFSTERYPGFGYGRLKWN